MKNVLLLFVIFLTMSCGTSNSLYEDQFIPYGIVEIADEIIVVGKLISHNDSILELSIDGAVVKYNKFEVDNFYIELRPDTDAMLRDIVINSKKTADNSGFFVTLTVISIAVAIVIIAIGI